MHTHHKETTLHVGDSRHVGNHVVFLVPTERVLQILKFLPLTPSILLWVLTEQVLFLFEFGHIYGLVKSINYFYLSTRPP